MQLGGARRLLLFAVLTCWLANGVYPYEDSRAWTFGRRVERVCTFEGYYSVPDATTTQPCPGTMPCSPGSYCTGGERRPCPAGMYGAEEGLRTKQCSAPCPEGFYCPEGTATPIECGGADRYCPLGSTQPIPVPDGFYSLGGEPTDRRRSSISLCKPGSFCVAGTSRRCPEGTYGATTKLSTPNCSGRCPVGHFCPKSSIQPTPCAAGTYGATEGLSDASCSGICPVGFACPEGTASPTTWPCDHDTFCPAGSANPRSPRRGTHVVEMTATEEALCPRGSFCSPDEAPGSSRLCPGGTFGNVTGLAIAACSGPCEAGYYCPRGSTSATQLPCGSVDVFCPAGSALPTPVAPGYYTIGKQPMAKGSLTVDALAAEHDKERITRVAQRQCQPGHYCVNGERYACPAGTFGNNTGLTTSGCSGVCAAGYYCPQGSIVAQALGCTTSAVFCPQGSAQPTTTNRGYCAVSESTAAGARWYDQRKAKPGEFAWRGSCYPCPAGRYGSEEMETRPTCSGPCASGYYCPPGSTSPTQHECGSASVYCPTASVRPWDILDGYYTSLQVRAMPPNATEAPGCEPGKYRDYSTTVSAFMDVITGRSPVTVNYGDYSFPVAECVACPDGTFKPGTGDDLQFCQPCPEYTTVSTNDRRSCSCFRLAGGTRFDASIFTLYFEKATLSCELVPKTLAAAIGDGAASNDSVYTRSEQFPCERGYYCLNGVRSPCPAGYYGDGNLETRSTCSGVCSSGFFCPLASWNSTARVCGDANVFCPSGSAVPIPVWPGYYSVRLLPFGADRLLVSDVGFEKYSISSVGEEAPKNEAIRDGQRICEPGRFCVDGKKYLCPVGRYGDKSGETSPLCTGLCSRGYQCPDGSTSSKQIECGGNNFICGTGSPVPQLVHTGYYSIGPTSTTRFFQQPCEPGHFCVDGVKYPCPAGTFGATSGLSTAACSGKCAPGYYCPLASISRTQNECGNSSVYCPEGTGKEPRFVSSGYYSVLTSGMADDGRNATQNDMKICPKGFYCRQGIRIRCPEGSYGDVEGLSAASCSGWCPEGYFCPFATTDYRVNPCLPGTYSTKGAAVCMQCPTSSMSRAAVLMTFQLLLKEEADKPPCTTRRECCFFG